MNGRTNEDMQIAIYGTGPIGSTFAFHLARAGHDVTCIARGARLAQLRSEGAIVTVSGQRAPVKPAETLEAATPFDLVIVTVLAHKVDAVLPALQASAARTIMFMFNQFESLDRLRDAVGAQRFAFGFPAILAGLQEGKLQAKIYARGQTSIASEARWAELFSAAGIATTVEPDMQGWLRTHAVLIATMMPMAVQAHDRGAGIGWGEAMTYARALREGFALVERLGDRIKPGAMRALQKAPTLAVAVLWWVFSRTRLARDIGAIGPAEPRALADAMIAAAGLQPTPSLRAIRP
jgi:2-dehydropantoate 2-reductase